MSEVRLFIENNGAGYEPDVEEPIVWETERQGVPGKLTFTVRKDKILNFQEGNRVLMQVDGEGIFSGFVFTKKRNKNGMISVTAYDQLRYLKNKDTIDYKEKKASELIVKLANAFKLELGEIQDTGYVIPQRMEDNQTLFDMIKNALGETLDVTRQLYVLYDDYGKLTLKNMESMKLDILIDQHAAEDFDYSSSIDGNTYNQIKLVYPNEETGKRDVYMEFDSTTIARWGVLQYFETLQNPENGKAKAEALLPYYNMKTRTLTISNAFGDIRVRAGSRLAIDLDLGDIIAKTYMLVDKVKHTLSTDRHFMDLTLIGGRDGFYA